MLSATICNVQNVNEDEHAERHAFGGGNPQPRRAPKHYRTDSYIIAKPSPTFSSAKRTQSSSKCCVITKLNIHETCQLN